MTGFEIVMSGLTAIYVGTTVFYAITSHKTLKTIERQAELTEQQAEASGEQFVKQIAEATKSADAATKSAEALTDSQRSWFLVKHVEEPQMTGVWIENITYVFEIIGNSPVRVIESKFVFRLVEGRPSKHNPKRMEADLPDSPIYGEPDTLLAIPTMGMILSPGEGPHVVVPLENMFLKKEDMEALQTWKKFACSWGFVRYRDAFSKLKIRETRFCYVYDVPQGVIPHDRNKENPNAFRIGGPPEYNEVS